MRGFCQLAGTVLLLSSWLVSEHFPPWVSWHAELPVFVGVFVISLIAAASRMAASGWAARMSLPRAAAIFLALTALVMVQTSVGQIEFAGDGLIIGLYLALCMMLLALGYAAAASDAAAARDRLDAWSSADLLAVTLLGGAVASALIALVQVLEVWEWAGWIVRMPAARRPGANLAQPNHLATLLVMGLASLVYLFETKRISAGFAACAFMLLATGIAATESRTGALEYGVLLLAWLLVRSRMSARLSVRAAALATLGFFVLFASWPALMAAAGIFTSGASLNKTASLRLDVWAQLWDAVMLRPWFGWGLRQVSVAQNAVAHAYASSQPFTYAHNIVLDLVLGAGFPLAAATVVLVGIWGWQRLHRARGPLQWYCVAVALAVGTHAMLEFPHAYAYLLAPPLFLLGVLDASTERPVFAVPAGLLAAGALLVAGLGLGTVWEYVSGEEDFRIVRFEALRVGQTPAQYERPKLHLLTQLDGLLEAGRIEPRPAMSAQALDIARKAALRFPWPATQNRYALALALNDEPSEAVRQLRVIRALHGERVYRDVKASWAEASNGKYPQLREINLP